MRCRNDLEANMDEKLSNHPSERGQSMAELAISLTFLLLLLAGAVDLGRAFFTYISLRDAAQEGALYGSIAPLDTAQITDRICQSSNYMAELCSDEIVDIEINLNGAACINNPIQVVVRYPNFPIVVPFSNVFLGNRNLTLTASTTDTILTPRCLSY
jgi:Flp pilus assembly protein TadG